MTASAQGETVTASPNCGNPGDSFQVNGSGWGAGGSVSLTFGPAYPVQTQSTPPPGTLNLTSATAKSDGTFSVAETVPSVAFSFSAYQITAKETIGEFPVAASTGFSVPCRILTVSPTCGSANDVVTVTGTGFAPRYPVAITFVPPAGGKPLASATPASDTTFRIGVSVPASPPGNYAVVATQNFFATAVAIQPIVLRAPFTIPCVKASIKLVPQVGPPGTVVTVTGTGFPIGAIVKLSWDHGVPLKVASITIGASQGFQIKLLIFPHDELGKRRLSAGPDLNAPNAIIFNIVGADFLVVPGSEQPRDFSWRR